MTLLLMCCCQGAELTQDYSRCPPHRHRFRNPNSSSVLHVAPPSDTLHINNIEYVNICIIIILLLVDINPFAHRLVFSSILNNNLFCNVSTRSADCDVIFFVFRVLCLVLDNKQTVQTTLLIIPYQIEFM